MESKLELEQFGSVEVPFRWRPGGEGKFVINPATGLCMCHSRYAMRILDDNGRLVWIDDSTAYGLIRFAIVDRNQGGADEILLIRTVHRGEDVANFYIK